MYKSLVQREIEQKTRKITELEFNSKIDAFSFRSLALPPSLDKVFASCWVDTCNVLIGTKCSSLLALDVAKCGAYRKLPLCTTSGQTGVHSLVLNPSHTLLAVSGGAGVGFVQIYAWPEFKLVACLVGHKNIVFSVSWIDDQTLVSGSKDNSVKLWRIPRDMLGTPLMLEPQMSCINHFSKVRSLIYTPTSKRTATLSADGTCKLWDRNFRVIRDISLFRTTDLVTLTFNQPASLYCIGSESHVTLLDPRCSSSIEEIQLPSEDHRAGVRCIESTGHNITIGTGYGNINFYDLRKHEYINPRRKLVLEPSIDADDIFAYIPFNRNAVFTLKYDPSETKLFAAGGALQMGFKSSCAGLFM